jgi:uncharacterized protein
VEITLVKAIVLLVVGLLVGFINVISGGGSLISIPVMIFLGLPANIANASSRVGILFQNIVAVKVFNDKGFKNDSFTYWLSASALTGSILGTFLAVKVDNNTFNIVLAIMMLVMFVLIMINPKRFHKNTGENILGNRKWISIIAFFFIGIYGGFIQAGTAILMMAVLNLVNNLNLIKVNFMKVFVVLGMNILSLIIFQYKGIINWQYGMAMAVGTAIGGYYGTIFSIEQGEIWVRRITLATILGMAIKLLIDQFYSFG